MKIIHYTSEVLKRHRKKRLLKEANRKAQLLRDAQRWDELEQLIGSLEQTLGNIVPVQLLRCRSYLWSGQYSAAIDKARLVLIEKEHPTAREVLARSYIVTGNLAKAESELTNLVNSALSGNIPGARISPLCSKLCESLYERQEPERAVAWAAKGMRLNDSLKDTHIFARLDRKELLKNANKKAQDLRYTESWDELNELVSDLGQVLGEIIPVQLLRCRVQLWSRKFNLAISEAKSILSCQDHPIARELLVRAYLECGDLALAELEMGELARLVEARRIRPRKVSELCARLGRLFYQKHEFDRAKEWGVQGLSLDAYSASAHALISNLYEISGNQEGAVASARMALESDPLMPEMARFLCLCSEDYEPQIYLSADKIVEMVRDHSNPGGRFIRAIKFLVNTRRINELPDIYAAVKDRVELEEGNREGVLLSLARAFFLDQAYEVVLDVLSQMPNAPGRHSDEIKLLKSHCYFEIGRFDEALKFALDAKSPDGKFDLAKFNAFIIAGRIGEAFDLYRKHLLPETLQAEYSMYYRPEIPVMEQRESSSLLLLASGGVGDEIRWASLYGELPDGFCISCDPRLKPLFDRSFPTLQFLSVPRQRAGVSNGLSATSHALVRSKLLTTVIDDSALEKMYAIGRVGLVQDCLSELRRSRNDFPKHQGYLKAHKLLVQRWSEFICGQDEEPGFHIALTWRSLLQAAKRDCHYLQADDLEPLGKLQSATFWVVQPAVTDAEWSVLQNVLPNVRPVPDLDLIDDFEGMAAFLMNMDVVISPCTTTAEISGALGVRTFLFGRSEQIRWRKNEDGTDIWHPSVEVVLRTGGNEMRNVLVQDIYEKLRKLSDSANGKSESSSVSA